MEEEGLIQFVSSRTEIAAGITVVSEAMRGFVTAIENNNTTK